MCKDPELGTKKYVDVAPPRHDRTKDKRRTDFVPTSQQEIHHVETRCGENSWQLKIVKCVNSRRVQRGLTCLLIFHTISLFTNLFLLAEYPLCSVVERDGVSCFPKEGWEPWRPVDNKDEDGANDSKEDSQEGWKPWKPVDGDNNEDSMTEEPKDGDWEAWKPVDGEKYNSTTGTKDSEGEWKDWKPIDNKEESSENETESGEWEAWKPVDTESKYDWTAESNETDKKDFKAWVPEGSGGGNRFLEVHPFWLFGESHHQEGDNLVCEDDLASTKYSAGCDEKKHATVRSVQSVLFELSMTILSIFLVEMSFLGVCLGMWKFCCNFWYMMDFFVVLFSLVAGFVSQMTSAQPVMGVGGMLVLFRMWRLVRIGLEMDSGKGNGNDEYVRQLEIVLRQNGIGLPQKTAKSLDQ